MYVCLFANLVGNELGQVVSDVSGVIFGGTLERMLTKLSLIQTPPLTTQQRQLPVSRNVAMAGAVVGVIIGCALGATTLLFVDLEARDRIQRAGQLRDIVNDMIALQPQPKYNIDNNNNNGDDEYVTSAGGFRTSCSRCTVYIADDSNDITLTNNNNNSSNSTTTTTRLKLMKEADSPSVRQSADSARFILSSDRNVLYVPVMSSKQTTASVGNKEVLAVVALYAANQAGFVEEDVVAAQIMSRHIAIFMNRLSD